MPVISCHFPQILCPEYAEYSIASVKTDVFSFGVLQWVFFQVHFALLFYQPATQHTCTIHFLEP